MTHPTRRSRRTAIATALLAAVALVGLAACSSGSGDGGTGGTLRTTLRLTIDSGADIRGVEVEIDHDPALVVLFAEPAGIFLGDTCEANVGSNFVNLLCLQDAGDTFDAPAPAWSLTVEYPSASSLDDLVFALSCLASDDIGNTFPVACSLD